MKKVSLSETLPKRELTLRSITDSDLSLEPTVHLSFQRRRKKDQVERQPHLEYRCKKTPRWEVEIPTLPPPSGRIAPERSIRGATVELGTPYLGPTSVAYKPAGHLQFPVSSIVAIMGG